MSWIIIKEMIDEADRDGDGEVNQDEFLRIMKKTSLYWSILSESITKEPDFVLLSIFVIFCTKCFVPWLCLNTSFFRWNEPSPYVVIYNSLWISSLCVFVKIVQFIWWFKLVRSQKEFFFTRGHYVILIQEKDLTVKCKELSNVSHFCETTVIKTDACRLRRIV